MNQGTRPYELFDKFVLFRSIILGIAAALAVPLFLSIASLGKGGVVEDAYNFLAGTSPTEGTSGVQGMFILGGFCIIAALSARSFVVKLSDRMLDAVEKKVEEKNQPALEELRRVTENISKNIGPYQDLSEEATKVLDFFASQKSRKVDREKVKKFAEDKNFIFEDTIDELSVKGFVHHDMQNIHLRGWGGLRILPTIQFGQDYYRILQILSELPDIPRPTTQQLSSDLNIETESVRNSLQQLEDWGLAKKSAAEADGWRIRSWGREILKYKTL